MLKQGFIAGLGLIVAATAVGGVTLVSETAEAHCGEHSGTCAGSSYISETYCCGTTNRNLCIIWDDFSGYCLAPAYGGPTGPCGAGLCRDGVNYGCYIRSHMQVHGLDPECD